MRVKLCRCASEIRSWTDKRSTQGRTISEVGEEFHAHFLRLFDNDGLFMEVDQSSIDGSVTRSRHGFTGPSLHAAIIGHQVLAGLEKGRQQAIERAKQIGATNALRVMALAVMDIQAGRSVRGRAGRISRKLGGHLKERTVRKILARLSSRADSFGHIAGNITEVSNDKSM